MDNRDVFLLDANAFITPYRQYYAFDLVPAYWDAINPFIDSGVIVVLDMVKKELARNDDALSRWIFNNRDLQIAKHNDKETIVMYQQVINYVSTCGYYNQNGIRSWADGNAADPWLIASSAVHGYVLVTTETLVTDISKKNPSKRVKIPNVAKDFGVEVINVFDMMRRIDVTINSGGMIHE